MIKEHLLAVAVQQLAQYIPYLHHQTVSTEMTQMSTRNLRRLICNTSLTRGCNFLPLASVSCWSYTPSSPNTNCSQIERYNAFPSLTPESLNSWWAAKMNFPKEWRPKASTKFTNIYVCIIGAGLGTQSRFVHKGNFNPVRALPTIHHHNNVQARVASKYTNSHQPKFRRKPVAKTPNGSCWAGRLENRAASDWTDHVELDHSEEEEEEEFLLITASIETSHTESSFVVPAVLAPMEFFAFQS